MSPIRHEAGAKMREEAAMRRQMVYGDGPHRSAPLTPPEKPPFDWLPFRKGLGGACVVIAGVSLMVGIAFIGESCNNASVAEETNERNRCEDWCGSRESEGHILQFWGTRPYHDPHQPGEYFRCQCVSRASALRFGYICRVEGDLVCAHE